MYEPLQVHIVKPVGSTMGIILRKNSNVVSRVLPESSTRVPLRPNDIILKVNGADADRHNIRDLLRQTKHGPNVDMILLRPTAVDECKESAGHSRGIASLVSCLPFLRCKQQSKRHSVSSIALSSPIALDAMTSVSSGVRPVDLRRLKKEGMTTMWYASNSPPNIVPPADTGGGIHCPVIKQQGPVRSSSLPECSPPSCLKPTNQPLSEPSNTAVSCFDEVPTLEKLTLASSSNISSTSTAIGG